MAFFGYKNRAGAAFSAVPTPTFYVVYLDLAPFCLENAQKDEKNELSSGRQKSVFICERAVKRCVDVGKNSKKHTRKLLDQLEFDYLFLYMTNSGFSPFSSYEHIRRKSIFATIPKHMPKSLSS